MPQKLRPWFIQFIFTFLLLALTAVADYFVRAGAANPPPFIKQHLDPLLLFVVFLAAIGSALLTVALQRMQEARRPAEKRPTFVVSIVVVASVTVIAAAVLLILLPPLVFGKPSGLSVDSQSIWQLFRDNGTGISALVTVVLAPVIVITLVIGAAQARQISKQLRLASITSSSLHWKELNELVLLHPAVAEIFEGKRSERAGWAADLVFGTFEARYLFYKEGLIDKDMWTSDVQTMREAFAQYTFLAPTWQNVRNSYYRPFREFIDNTIVAKPPTPPTPPQTDANGSGV
jgi:uncharacterized membrane protein YidH (DUF202 family)